MKPLANLYAPNWNGSTGTGQARPRAWVLTVRIGPGPGLDMGVVYEMGEERIGGDIAFLPRVPSTR